jgi:hypothetical protein
MIGALHKNTNNIKQTITQNVQYKPPDVTVDILISPYGYKTSNCVTAKNVQNWVCYVASWLYMADTNPVS